jgi:hypothetical protein
VACFTPTISLFLAGNYLNVDEKIEMVIFTRRHGSSVIEKKKLRSRSLKKEKGQEA